MTRTVVVAGVGEGLGSSLAWEFAEAGDRVAMLARSEAFLETLADEITTETDGEALAAPTDVSDTEAVAATYDTIHERFGGVDVQINNVAGANVGGDTLSTTRAELTEAWSVRVAGQYQCARRAAQDMADGDGGTILWTTSQQARVPRGSVASVTARQAARGTARAMADNLGEHGVQSIHVVVDGWIENPSLRERYPDHDDWMDPDEIARLYRDLADDPETVHASEIDLRHPNDELRF
ncbi:SDR family NAD(P)-dependent oxidoreductase [Halobaculum sp. MBLA0143]|uniref:SDR family NAD(P)-dependent oxidoreductase n=1 Tax=Halobaculum sp. MBLA0143 TaxID=3079933 RepID=UPI003525EE4D